MRGICHLLWLADLAPSLPKLAASLHLSLRTLVAFSDVARYGRSGTPPRSSDIRPRRLRTFSVLYIRAVLLVRYQACPRRSDIRRHGSSVCAPWNCGRHRLVCQLTVVGGP